MGIRDFVFIALLLTVVGATGASYNRRAKNPNVNVQWFYEVGAEYVTFKVQSPFSTGWVGIGFNDKMSMVGEDCVVGWIDQNGKGNLEDRHAIQNGEPILDQKQDYILISASNKNGTTFEFKRKVINCDKDDYKFSQGHTYLLFVYSENYPTMENGTFRLPFHKNNRFASKEIILNTAAALEETLEQPKDTTSTYDIELTNFTIPQRKTTYWCQIFEIPKKYTDTPHYFTGYRPIITPGKEKYFHHAGVGTCRVNPSQWAERTKVKGFDCTTPEKFTEIISCFPSLISFVIGSPGEYYPSDIAYPFGEKAGGGNYLYYQAHFDNFDLAKDVLASSKLRLFLTTKKRNYIAGSLAVVSPVDYTVAIPPKQPSFGYSIICPQTCLNLLREEEPITVFAVLAHMHTTGKTFRIRHFDKNGIELKPIYEDNNYIFDSQETYMLPERIKLRKGESFSTECYYDTTDRTETVLGGLSTVEEMCLAVLYVYPMQPSFSACSFSILKKEQAGFLGIQQFDEKSDLITEPSSLKGKTVKDVLTNFKWSKDKIEQYREMAMNGNKAGACIGVGGALLGQDYTKINVTKVYRKPKGECDF